MRYDRRMAQTPKPQAPPVNTSGESSTEVAVGSIATGVALLAAQHYGLSADDLTWVIGTLAGVAGTVTGAVHAIRTWRKNRSAR